MDSAGSNGKARSDPQNRISPSGTKKRKLADAHLALDMPILFTFEREQLLLWLVEFQEDKSVFSVHKLLRYMTDETEAYPEATVIPTVLFTDRKKWRKDVRRRLDSAFGGRTFLHFEYVFVKLFDLKARDFYHYDNPLIKILLPKMNYEPEERAEVIRQALTGLYRLAKPILFDKYSDFIDIYAEVREEERESLYRKINEQKEEGTAMLMQYIRERLSQEVKQEVKQEVRQEVKREVRQEVEQEVRQVVKQEIRQESLLVVLKAKFGTKGLKTIMDRIGKIADSEKLNSVIEMSVRATSPQEVLKFIEEAK